METKTIKFQLEDSVSRDVIDLELYERVSVRTLKRIISDTHPNHPDIARIHMDYSCLLYTSLDPSHRQSAKLFGISMIKKWPQIPVEEQNTICEMLFGVISSLEAVSYTHLFLIFLSFLYSLTHNQGTR